MLDSTAGLSGDELQRRRQTRLGVVVAAAPGRARRPAATASRQSGWSRRVRAARARRARVEVAGPRRQGAAVGSSRRRCCSGRSTRPARQHRDGLGALLGGAQGLRRAHAGLGVGRVVARTRAPEGGARGGQFGVGCGGCLGRRRRPTAGGVGGGGLAAARMAQRERGGDQAPRPASARRTDAVVGHDVRFAASGLPSNRTLTLMSRLTRRRSAPRRASGGAANESLKLDGTLPSSAEPSHAPDVP